MQWWFSWCGSRGYFFGIDTCLLVYLLSKPDTYLRAGKYSWIFVVVTWIGSDCIVTDTSRDNGAMEVHDSINSNNDG